MKIEDDNRDPDSGKQRQIYCFAISAKRYALFLLDERCEPVLLRKGVNDNSMPYKDPERKRQWEREHREQRNARRRALKLTPQTDVLPKSVSDPLPGPTSGWKMYFGLAVGVGIIVLGGLAKIDLPSDLGRLSDGSDC